MTGITTSNINASKYLLLFFKTSLRKYFTVLHTSIYKDFGKIYDIEMFTRKRLALEELQKRNAISVEQPEIPGYHNHN